MSIYIFNNYFFTRYYLCTLINIFELLFLHCIYILFICWKCIPLSDNKAQVWHVQMYIYSNYIKIFLRHLKFSLTLPLRKYFLRLESIDCYICSISKQIMLETATSLWNLQVANSWVVCFRFKLQTHVLCIIYNENHISLRFTEIACSILL